MDHLSVSRLRTWLFCPGQYYERYILGLSDYNVDMDYGSEYHQQLENYHKGNPWIGLPEAYTTKYAPDHYKSEEEFTIGLRHPETEELLSVAFTGRIDAQNSDEIVDFKTSNKSWSQVMADKDIQATAYLYQHWQTTGELLPFTFIIFRKDWLPTSKFDQVQVRSTTRTVADFTSFWLQCYKAIQDMARENDFHCTCLDQKHNWINEAQNMFAERIR